MELKTDGTANAAYTYGYSRNSRDTSDGASYYLYDGRGSVSGLTSAGGVTTNSYQYDPYGNTIFGTPVSINYYGYNGESTNTNTGYQYLRARYYNPVNGNFTTEDTNTGTTENPLTRNRYGYVNNNPLNYEDPTGHSLWSKIKSTASKAVSTVKKVAKKAVNTVKNVAKKVVNTVKSAVNWVVNAVTHPKQTIQKAVEQAQTTYRNVKRAASSAGSNFVKTVSSGFQKAGRTFSSFKEYVSVRTSEIKATIKRELCTTANKITDALGKVDWKSVGITVAAIGVSTLAVVATGGLATGVVLGALPAMGGLGTAVVTGAVTGVIGGASYSATESILSGDSAGEVVQDTLKGGLLGGLTGGATGALGYGVNNFIKGVTKTQPGHITEMATKDLSSSADDAVTPLLEDKRSGQLLLEDKRAGQLALPDKTTVQNQNNGATKKPYANSRPSYTKNQVEEVWEMAKDPVTGKVYDPTGVEITWDRTKPRNGQWDMGHIPEEKYSEIHKLYMDDVISKDEFLDWYHNPKNYRPELPSTNRGHKFE